MAYFRDAYQKLFLGTKLTTANANQVTGFLITAGLGTNVLPVNTGTAATTYGLGSWGLFDPSTWQSVTTASLGATKPILVLAAASMQQKDQIGGFHGGYTETNKSKGINPKLINRFLRIDPCTPRQQTIHIGKTKYTSTLSPTRSDCCFAFYCGELYNLRIEIKGEPMYRFLDRSGIRLLEYGPVCCPDGAPLTQLDSTLVMIEWANQIINDPILQSFISPIVYSEAGVALYAPGTVGVPYTWDNYVTPGHKAGACAGIRLQGAYFDTVFGDCSFQPTDYFNKVPIEIYASMVDFNGDPCAFTGICTVTECNGLEGNGYGETVLRDMILSESYRQNKFPTESQRIREIEQGSDILSGITRSAFYTRYVIQHQIPRYDNANSTYSMEQYDLQIITNGTVATFETLMAAWLSNANSYVTLETTSCGTCIPLTP